MERKARSKQAPERSEQETIEDFVAGRGALANIGAVSCPGELQVAFQEEVLAVRAGLIRKFGSELDVVMLCDTAATAFFEARHLSMHARTVLRESLDDDHVKRAQRFEEMGSRAHRRALIALEMLHRPQGASVRMQVGQVENMMIGDQKLKVGT